MTPLTRRTVQRLHPFKLRMSSDIVLHLCLDDDIGGIGDISGEERSIAGQVRRVEA